MKTHETCLKRPSTNAKSTWAKAIIVTHLSKMAYFPPPTIKQVIYAHPKTTSLQYFKKSTQPSQIQL